MLILNLKKKKKKKKKREIRERKGVVFGEQ